MKPDCKSFCLPAIVIFDSLQRRCCNDTYFYMENAGETVYCLDRFYGFHEGDTGFPAMSRCLWFTELLEQGYLVLQGCLWQPYRAAYS
ncbi:MAG: hypothetical protein ACLRL6_01365 [Clostridium sp.]